MSLPRFNNIRGLAQDLTHQLELRMAQFRQAEPEMNVRPADAKMFMLIARHSSNVAELAKVLGISRQGAHSSVKRLVDHGVIVLDLVEGNNKEKIPSITDKGHQIRKVVATQLGTLEQEMLEILSEAELETLRNLLMRLVVGMGKT